LLGWLTGNDEFTRQAELSEQHAEQSRAESAEIFKPNGPIEEAAAFVGRTYYAGMDDIGPSLAAVGTAGGRSLGNRGGSSGGGACPCFTGDALVQTEYGLARIDTIQVGDRVWAFDEFTGRVELMPVIDVIVTPNRALVEVKLVASDGTRDDLRVTPNHPFWVRGRGWVAAADLLVGEDLLDGSSARIRIESAGTLAGGETVYNLEVSRFHTYSVGLSGAWVHNACTGSCPPSGNGAKPLSQWLKDQPDVLEQARSQHQSSPQWQGIDPDRTPVFYRSKADVDAIRAKPGESGGHHPHGLALGGPEGQTLTPTGETRTQKSPQHTAATSLQRIIINILKKQQ